MRIITQIGKRLNERGLRLWGGPSVLLFCWVGSAWALADLSPDWSRSGDLTQSPNCSFLNNLHHQSRINPFDDLLDAHAFLGLNQRFQDMSRDYELKRQYGLVDMQREQDRSGQVQGFGREILGEVRRYQTKKQTDQLTTAVEREESLKPLIKPVAVVGAGAAIYGGKPMKFKLSDDTQVGAMTNVPRQLGQFSLNSPVINSAVDVDMSKPEDRDPSAPPDLDPTHQRERYRLSMSRGLPVWNLNSGLSYGGTTSSVTASLSKQLTDHLTAVVDTIQPMDASRYYSQESLKFFYGLNF